MNKYICIHGHFYQPPREDAWTGVIERQRSAAPFHNWNERITEECYRANTQSPILGENGEPNKIINNFEWMSFNIGPTLFSWLEAHDPQTYKLILEADRKSMGHFDGCGNAIAQAYNHLIMPLANERDKQTQVIWGIKDFEYRFKRKPLGMWLPETAVDLRTLEILVEHGIKFTILAPKQAKAVKSLAATEWTEVDENTINTKVPYVCHLPSGDSINLFFYDGFISSEVAFGKIIRNAEEMYNHMIKAVDGEPDELELVHIATDGETYGHHRRFGNMAFSYLVEHTQTNKHVNIANYTKVLKDYAIADEVRIHENTAWSSSVGVERWKSAEGGCIHHKEGWTQEWRGPLREAMDWLRDELIPVYEQAMRERGEDPWQARNNYIQRILECSNTDPILDMQHMSMLMYTSCGWFFDDVSGIETVQILQYAARAIELAREECGVELEPGFLKILSEAKSNHKRKGTAKDIYGRMIKRRKRHG